MHKEFIKTRITIFTKVKLIKSNNLSDKGITIYSGKVCICVWLKISVTTQRIEIPNIEKLQIVLIIVLCYFTAFNLTYKATRKLGAMSQVINTK